ncbi:MAG: DUF4410 domain-containing protein [Candidatus Methylomirabilales bacterium]
MKVSKGMRRDWLPPSLGITLMLILVGCGAGKTLVMKPPETKLRVTSVSFSEGNSTIAVPAEAKKAFEEKLAELLYEEQKEADEYEKEKNGEGAFKMGDDLKIKYRFVQYDKGDRFTRWFWGGIGNAGEGSLTIEVKYFDVTDKELATIQSEGKISSGFFGGAINFAVGKAAEEIAEYTVQNFK